VLWKPGSCYSTVLWKLGSHNSPVSKVPGSRTFAKVKNFPVSKVPGSRTVAKVKKLPGFQSTGESLYFSGDFLLNKEIPASLNLEAINQNFL